MLDNASIKSNQIAQNPSSDVAEVQQAVRAWLDARDVAEANPNDCDLGTMRVDSERAAWRALHLYSGGNNPDTSQGACVSRDGVLMIALPLGEESVEGGHGVETVLAFRESEIARIE